MNLSVTGILPPKVRQVVYVVYILVGVAIVACQAAIDPDPAWLNAAQNVFTVLTAAGFGVAASNVSSTPVVQTTPQAMTLNNATGEVEFGTSLAEREKGLNQG